MVDQATEQMVVGASPERTWEVLTNFPDYPIWAHDLKSVTVLEHDEEGRGLLVRFRAAAMGRSTSYTLRYDFSDAPRVLAWKLEDGDITRALDGSYELRPVDGQAGQTEVIYQLTVDLVIPLPGFVKRRAESRLMHTALRGLQGYLEK
ncbi:MAG TPA: SRPBCC family protein [Acidimicrobiales bacterium]|jgi:uncharacterized membrane protein